MAYADHTFYAVTFYGDVLTADNADKWLDRASDEVDHLTFGRLASAFPTDEAHAAKVRKAVCAIADALCCIDEQRRAASAQKAADGSYRGAVSSVSSGKESISFAAIGNAVGASVYAAAAASAEAQAALIGSLAAKYLADIPDANGVNLLYAGGVRNVTEYNHSI